MNPLPQKIRFLSMIYIWISHGDPFIYHYFNTSKVLDVGCGTGSFIKRNPRNYYGIDISNSLVNICVQQGLNAIVGSATDLPFKDENIEAINCNNLIEHLSPDSAAIMLNEFARVLKKGGIVMLRSPLGENVWDTFSHIRPYPPTAIKKLITSETEDFVRPDNNHLKQLHILHIYFQGKYFKNRILFFLSNTWTHFIPWSRKSAYVLILTKSFNPNIQSNQELLQEVK
ncbi:MAG: class I SAM-dependent methyltransferase [Nostoc desertorum CM1-VF14]|jgi:ubiquinone/menaquinone biosynthesis C-methylase UbiE|nr:class I SAM-dependent methyltransferase [Nostoc desertorum CM1-VF14]